MVIAVLVVFPSCTTAAAPEETAAPEKKLVFGNLPIAMSDEWNGYSTENFIYAVEKKGVEVQVLDAGWDGAKQLANLEDLIIKQVDEIGVFVYTPEEAETFSTKAKEAGIPISFENTKLMNYDFQGEYLFNVACEYDSPFFAPFLKKYLYFFPLDIQPKLITIFLSLFCNLQFLSL